MKRDVNDSCGCAMGAWFMVAGLLVLSAYYGWQCFDGELSLLSAAIRVSLGTFLAAGAGKIVGILRYRIKAKRLFHSIAS